MWYAFQRPICGTDETVNVRTFVVSPLNLLRIDLLLTDWRAPELSASAGLLQGKADFLSTCDFPLG